METFQVPAEHEETARQALGAYQVIQEEGARTRRIGQAASKRTLEAIRRTSGRIESGGELNGDEVETLTDAVSEYVRVQRELAMVRRLSARAREQLTEASEELLYLLQGEEVHAEV